MLDVTGERDVYYASFARYKYTWSMPWWRIDWLVYHKIYRIALCQYRLNLCNFLFFVFCFLSPKFRRFSGSNAFMIWTPLSVNAQLHNGEKGAHVLRAYITICRDTPHSWPFHTDDESFFIDNHNYFVWKFDPDTAPLLPSDVRLLVTMHKSNAASNSSNNNW